MKYNEIMKPVFSGLLYCLLLTELQYCSQAVSAATVLRINTEYEAQQDQQQKDALQDAISPRCIKPHRSRRKSLMVGAIGSTTVYPEVEGETSFDSNSSQVYSVTQDPVLQICDAAIVAYWISPNFLSRIEMSGRSLNLPAHQILYDVVRIDDTLQKNKSSMKEELYRARLATIEQSQILSKDSKKYILKDMKVDKVRVIDRLWLEHLYAQVDGIHKGVQRTKVANSHYAWPYIKEIHVIKKFPTMYGSQVSR